MAIIWNPSIKFRTNGHKNEPSLKRKVFVGLSGGVDSSVSAALLKKATPNNFEKLFGRPTPKGFRGFDVTGVFIQVWQPEWLNCSAAEDRLDAMRVCAALGIPFRDLDLSAEYKKEVADYMVSEYKIGRTPNPDVMCNRSIKFGGFYSFAIKNGADFVATGHYARVKELSAFSFQLLAGRDKNKDQSYFLWNLKQAQLPRILFPVGQFTKLEVRKFAKKSGLPTAEKKDSQGLCFLGKVDLREFLSHYLPPKRGNVLNERGEKIGWHDGVQFFTEGERHGFTITRTSANGKPYYVVAKDVGKNILTVSTKTASERLPTAVSNVSLSDTNWLSGEPEKEKIYQARFRYRAPLVDCVLEKKERGWEVFFRIPQSFITPGQSLVVYDGEEVKGGGVIERAD